MKTKYFIEVTDVTYEGTKYVTYVNKKSWESKTPQFFTDEAEAKSVVKDFEDYIRTEYGSYKSACIHFRVIDLHESIKEYTESIPRSSEELRDRLTEVTLVRSKLDKAIDSGEFEEAHDKLDDYEFILDKTNRLSEELDELKGKLDKYKSWI